MRSLIPIKGIILGLVILTTLAIAPLIRKTSVSAATFRVTTTADGGAGSLRSTIANALGAALSSEGAVIDATGVSGVINLEMNLPELRGNLTINGPGPEVLTVQRKLPNQNTFGIFTIGTNSSVTINGLSIKNGFEGEGGGIFNYGTLTVNNCTIADNVCNAFGGGIFNQNKLTVNNCTIANNKVNVGLGGGIFNTSGVVSISNTEFINNSARLGGGVYSSSGELSINKSTLTGNTSEDGAGIYSNDALLEISNSTIANNTGGGILVGGLFTQATITNSTIANNLGFGVYCSSRVTISNCTIAGNHAPAFEAGGGLSNHHFLTLQSTIVAKNTGAFPDMFGSFTSGGNNLIGDTTTSSGADVSLGDLINVDPMLETGEDGKPLLRNNGGRVQTIALLPTSPAIDKGKNLLALTTDQRSANFSRTVDDPFVNNANGDGTDIGAFEAQILLITGVSKSGKHLVISGNGFVKGIQIYINGEQRKTIYESPDSLIGKKAGKGIVSGAKIIVRTPDGLESNEWTYQ